MPHGVEFGIPDKLAFSDQPRTLLVLAQPSSILSMPMGLHTSELPIALKGRRGLCAYTVDMEEEIDFPDFFVENWL